MLIERYLAKEIVAYAEPPVEVVEVVEELMATAFNIQQLYRNIAEVLEGVWRLLLQLKSKSSISRASKIPA